MILTLQRGDSIPLYRQIVNQLRGLIELGSLAPGSRLPTVRQLATDHELTRLTVQNAYAELQEQGWIESAVGRGTFVSRQPRPLAGQPSPSRLEIATTLSELLDRSPGQLRLAQAAPDPDSYPSKELKACLGAALQDSDSLGYGPIQGEESLRVQLSRVLLERGLASSPDQVLVTGGAQQAIDLVLRALSTPDQPVAVEVPAYPGVLESLQARGQAVIEIPLQGDCEELCRRHRPCLFYTVPTFHNPTGQVASPERRQNLLELAARYDFRILEDDVYGLLNLDGPAPSPLKASDAEGRVIYLSSFSKTVAPALRLGMILAGPSQLTALCQLKQAGDLVSSSLLQQAMAEFLRRGCLEPHIQKVRRLYRERRDALVEAFSHLLPGLLGAVPMGGLSAWVKLPCEVDESELHQEARQTGLVVARGQAFFATPQPQGHLRLSFGASSPSQLQQAVQILARLLEEHLRRKSSLKVRACLGSRPLV